MILANVPLTAWLQAIFSGVGVVLILTVLRLIRAVGRLGDIYESYMGHPATELLDAVPSIPKRMASVENSIEAHSKRLTKIEQTIHLRRPDNG